MSAGPDAVRYHRQIILPQVGPEGQARLAAARVAIIGAGGLGSPAALYLAAAGVGRITIVDSDEVELSNLHRQILHATSGVGSPKVESAAATLRDLNPGSGLGFRSWRGPLLSVPVQGSSAGRSGA